MVKHTSFHSFWTDNTKIPGRFGKLNEINKFDATFFNILSNAADVMDPMSRILLEKTYEAIIDAGTFYFNFPTLFCPHDVSA